MKPGPESDQASSVLVQGYLGIDLQAVWSVVVQDLPVLSAALARMAEHRA